MSDGLPDDRTRVPTSRLAAIIQSSEDAIISKDLTGIITTWNSAAEQIFGYSEEEAVGQNILLLIPNDLQHEERRILDTVRSGSRVRPYETTRRRKDGSLVDISLSVSPIIDASRQVIGISKIARDISERKQAERLLARAKDRYETLNTIAKSLSSKREFETVIAETTELATKVLGAQFGAFFYNVVDQKGERYLLYSLSGAPKEAFDKFGMPRNTAVFNHTFTGQGPVRSDDIRKDLRYGLSPPHYGQPKGHLPVVSYLAVPVKIGDGEVFGGLFFGHDKAGKFDDDAERLAEGIAGHAAIAIDNARMHEKSKREVEYRRAAEETKELLLSELKHRVKNTLSTITAIATQTLRNTNPQELRAFIGRVHALAKAQDLLTKYDWEDTDLGQIIDQALSPFQDRHVARLSISGPTMKAPSSKALLIAVVVHELATNALKYGAWSTDKGKVSLIWDLDESGRKLRLVWVESDGPPVKIPHHQGFGSNLIYAAFRRSGGESSLDFDPSGVKCRISIDL